ncbi:uncharacterized protein N7496_001400 [Penicillium cataractarum]|uniref:Uncharacterized protein n=1 Tax=Penicillium cataractarum TaxID=2100454 RepID=A0A9W9VVW8_9EURO|nr:uncharacterized protein N7496_001400 [Penicillium cataractarum]KAJ5390332.1 hypothetical protein N7496_001400 [Penicillium cataractarum]
MDDVKPTARWANRMLRPLASIYRRLEKHHETLAIIAADSNIREHNTNIHTHTQGTCEAVKAQDNDSGSDADEDDPVWVPGKKPDQRRVRHKYSSRGEGRAGKRRTRLSIHSPEASRTLPGAIELATPVITGKRWEAPTSAQSQLSVEQKRQSNAHGQLQAFRDKYPLHKSPWQELLGQSGDTGFASIVHNLDRILQNFLCNTRITKRDNNDASAQPFRGTRSLLSTVVRRLPEFIANEQDAQDELEEDGDEDMCDAYFTELENYYAVHGQGWKPLREAVRAQGIYLVSTMITNRWLTDPIACALIEKCRYHEPDACESLLSIFLSTRTGYHYPVALKPPTDSNEPGDPIRLLRKYAHYGPAHRSYIFDELSKLLTRGVLPPEWMATKSWTSWMTRATISFSRGDSDCAAASRLIEAVPVAAADILPTAAVSRSERGDTNDLGPVQGRQTRTCSFSAADNPDLSWKCPVPVEDALSNHVTSLLAALCGMHISRSRELDDLDDFEGTKAGHIINYLCSILEKDLELQPPSHVTTLTFHQLLRRGSILLADCLLQCNDAVLKTDHRHVVGSTPILERYCETLASRSGLVKEFALFVRQAFRCFGSSTDDERLYMGREVRRMVSRLPRMSDAPALSTFLGRVAVEVAMEFAESTGEPDDHVWAVEVQETVISLLGKKEPSPESSEESEDQRPRSGCFRWEESIGEWVARTPAVKSNAPPSAVTRGRPSLTPRLIPCIPCSTDSSSPEPDHESDRFMGTPSSLTSSPPSTGLKRTFECTESSPLRPAKRRQPAPVIVEQHGRNLRRRSGLSSATIAPKTPSLEPVPSQRRALRELSSRMKNTQAPRPTEKPATKVEVVIINKAPETAPVESASESEPDLFEKQIHRPVERRRSGRSRISILPSRVAPVVARRKSMVIPCSEDDSDDELSFL